VGQLYPRALGSLSVASYDSQGYVRGILTLYQPGGPGPLIYTPQEQGAPVIPRGTGFPLLAGLRWGYSNPPPTWRARASYLYPPQEQAGPVIPPGTGLTPFGRVSYRYLFSVKVD
jgi:hypothetical protein